MATGEDKRPDDKRPARADAGPGREHGRPAAAATSNSYLSGQLLIAMPTMRDPRFARTVIYMCAHTSEGAMGIVVNRLIGSLSFDDLLKQLGLDGTGSQDARKVHFGGPVETSRGFVLHSSHQLGEGSLQGEDEVGPTPP